MVNLTSEIRDLWIEIVFSLQWDLLYHIFCEYFLSFSLFLFPLLHYLLLVGRNIFIYICMYENLNAHYEFFHFKISYYYEMWNNSLPQYRSNTCQATPKGY